MMGTIMKRPIVALITIAPVVGAQQVVPARPATPAAQSFTFPRVQSHKLPNGLRVLIVEDHSVPVVAVRAVLGVDEMFDPAGKEGTYQLMLGALREGTVSRTPEQIAEVSAKIGTPVSPTALTTTPAALDGSLELMGDMLMHPSFPQAGIERRKGTQSASFRGILLRPATPAKNLFYALLDGRDDPYTRSLYANEQGVAAITRDDVMAFYDEHVGPGNTTIIIVGDETDANALAIAKRVFGGWTKTANVPARPASAAPPVKPTTIYLLDVPGAATGYVYVGNAGPARLAPDAFATEMASTIAANRFVAALREKRSLMYTGAITIFWRPAPRNSEFFGYTNIAPQKVDSALVEWISVLRGLRGENPPTATELEIAKRARVGPLWTRTDGPDSVATRMAEAVRDNLRPDFLQAYAAGVTTATLQGVTAAMSKYVDIDHLVIVVSGDRKVLEPALRATRIAPVVVVDGNGKPIANATP